MIKDIKLKYGFETIEMLPQYMSIVGVSYEKFVEIMHDVIQVDKVYITYGRFSKEENEMIIGYTNSALTVSCSNRSYLSKFRKLGLLVTFI